VSDPWDPEQRRPLPENDADWPERDLWQSWDRPAEPEPAADTELPWVDAEGDELWSDSVGARPVSSVPWTGPTWDDQPWAEPGPDLPRPDLSAFIDSAALAEPPAEVEEREPEPVELEPEPEPVELERPEPEPPAEVEQREPELAEPERPQPEAIEPELAEPEAIEPEPIPSVLEPIGRFEPADEAADEPAWMAPEPVAEARWSEPEPITKPEWNEPEPITKPEWSEPEPITEAEWSLPRPAAEAWTVPEQLPEPAWSEPAPVAEPEWGADESVAEGAEEPPWTPLEPVPESPEPTEQAFAAFAPERESEAVAEAVPAPPEAALEPELEPEPEPEPEPDERSRPFEPFEVIEGGAFRGSLGATAGEVETTMGAELDWDGRSERRQPTTAETVVPWLIGVILLLTGMVIVLLALIFTSDNGLLAGLVSPSPAASGIIGLSPSADPAGGPSGTPAASTASTPNPSTTSAPVIPTYGPLEMVYLGRSAPLAHIYLLQHDFTADEKPVVLAQDPAQDVERLAWSPDGTHGAAIIAGRLVSIEEARPKRALADGIVASTFAPDGKILYALRIVLGNGTDRAEVLQITYASGDTKKLSEWTFPRPVIGAESAVKEAQFADEGGSQRLFWMKDGSLRIWMLGAPTYGVSPKDGKATKLDAATLPKLWATDGMKRIELTESGGTSTLTLRNPDGGELAKTSVKGLVSHLRWSPDDSQVAFTVGRSVGEGVQQDLFLWDLGKGKAPMQLTNTGAAFGAEWLGASESWRP
jgi:hypothetical protein